MSISISMFLGPVPDKNPLFMLFLAATIKAVDTHGDLMRAAIAGAANDHRLGANEAPPAIVSVYLGGDIQQAVDRYVNGHTDAPQLTKQLVDLGIPVLPEVKKDTTDRNRTSTFAFTNNKFEFRAVGSSQNPSRTNQVLNTIVADSVKQLGEEIYKEKQRGASTDAAIKSVVSKALKKHMRVVYDGNGYSEEWPIEAKRRGLPNLRQTPEALDVLSDQKNIDLYERVGVLSKAELLARQEILYEEYQKKISIEGKCLAGMARNHILPAAIEYQSKCAEAISNVNNDQATKNQQSHLQEITKHINTALGAVKHLDEVVDAIEKQPSPKAMAHYANKSIKPALDTVREPLDALEQLLPRSLWPFPVYHEMLFHQD
jgi:glutamine synthetase